MATATDNPIADLRHRIMSGDMQEEEVHYVCCQLIATLAAAGELSPSQTLNVVEGVKDEIEEMDFHWLEEDDDGE